MMVIENRSESRIDWLTHEESVRFFDAQAQMLLGISGQEFLDRWDRGEYDAFVDDPDHPEYLQLVMLLPFGRQS